MMDAPGGFAFNIGNIDDIFNLDFLDSDSEDEKLLQSIDFSQFNQNEEVPQTEQPAQPDQEPQPKDAPQPEQNLQPEQEKQPEDAPQLEQTPQPEQEPQPEDVPQLEDPQTKENSARFRDVTMEEIAHFYDSTQSKSTKFNTKWCVKIIQDWSMQMCGQLIDFEAIPTNALADVLTRFYCSAKPQKEKEYHKNTLKNIRAGINRHLQNIGRNINIVSDTKFKTVNRVFNGMLKERVKTGASLPTKHKEIISRDDMAAIHQYFEAASNSPVVLRHFVWFSIAFHFVTRGNETHFQLTPTSFSFQNDHQGEFAMLVHETMKKNHQGGIGDRAENSGKVMYATGGPLCPVRMLRLLIQKTEPDAQKLFNQYNADAIFKPVSTTYWYTSKPLSQRTFGYVMPDISKAAKTSIRYTNHCVRATAIRCLNDADVEARHIMFLSDHTNESSIRSYNRSVSQEQKRRLSATLSSAMGEELPLVPLDVQRTRDPRTQITQSRPPLFPVETVSNLPTQPPSSSTCTCQSTYQQSNGHSMAFDVHSSGFLSHSVFTNCSFTFGK